MGFKSKDFLMAFLVGVIVNGFDVITDFMTGAKLLEENLEWGALVIGLTFLPFLYVFAETFLYWILIKGICEGIFRQKASILAPRGYKFTAKDLINCFYEFPGVRATRNAWILVNHQLVLKKLEARQEDSKRNNNEIPPEEAPMMQSSRPEDDEENIRSEMRNASMSEFILESYPQAGFQIYLMGVLNFTSPTQAVSILASFASALALFTNLVSDQVGNDNVVFLGFQLLWNALVFMLVLMHSIYGFLVFPVLLILFQMAKIWILLKNRQGLKNDDSNEELKQCRILVWMGSTILLHKVHSKAFVKVTSISILITFIMFFTVCLNFYEIVNFFDPVSIHPDKFLAFVITGVFFFLTYCISFIIKVC